MLSIVVNHSHPLFLLLYDFMRRFFKRKFRSNDEESSTQQHAQLNLKKLPSNEQQSSQQHAQINLEELPSDLGKWIKISAYHPNDQ